MLCCVVLMLCCGVLCSVVLMLMLCCGVVWCVVLCCVVLCCVVLCCVVLCCVVLCCVDVVLCCCCDRGDSHQQIVLQLRNLGLVDRIYSKEGGWVQVQTPVGRLR